MCTHGSHHREYILRRGLGCALVSDARFIRKLWSCVYRLSGSWKSPDFVLPRAFAQTAVAADITEKIISDVVLGRALVFTARFNRDILGWIECIASRRRGRAQISCFPRFDVYCCRACAYIREILGLHVSPSRGKVRISYFLAFFTHCIHIHTAVLILDIYIMRGGRKGLKRNTLTYTHSLQNPGTAWAAKIVV